MNKFCRKCGETKEADCFYGDHRTKNGLSSPCKECRQRSSADFRVNNRAKYKAAISKWRQNNPARYKSLNSYKPGGRHKRSVKKSIDNLSDSYVKSLICNSTKLVHSDIPSSLVEAKRIQILNMRIIKNEKHS